MYHSIKFGDKNTWEDWHLIPSSRPLFNPPRTKTQIWEVPGRNGSVDGTECLTGYPLFENRTGSIEFIVANGYWDWTVAYSTIMNYLHGKRMTAILEDDPKYYYEGRFSVNTWKSDKNWSTITIDYEVAPYKKSVIGSMDPWPWDSFNFETDIIRNGNDIHVNGETVVSIIGSAMIMVPTITASSEMSVTFRGETYEIPANEPTLMFEIELVEGENELIFKGDGIVDIEYRAGEL